MIILSLNALSYGRSIVFLLLFLFGITLMEIGSVQKKGTYGVILINTMTACVSVLAFWLIGTGFAYGHGNAFGGMFDFFSFGDYSESFPPDVPIQMIILRGGLLTAIISAAVNGSLAERVRPAAMVFFSGMNASVAAPIVLHWEFSGFLQKMGIVDESNLLTLGIAACAGAIPFMMKVGPRTHRFSQAGTPKAIPPQDMVVAFAGKLLMAIGIAGLIDPALAGAGEVLTLALSMAAAGITTTVVTSVRYEQIDIAVVVDSMLTAELAVSACATNLNPFAALLCGIIVGFVIVFVIETVEIRLRLDDPSGTVAIYGTASVIGILFDGLFSRSGGVIYTESGMAFAAAIFGILLAAAYLTGLSGLAVLLSHVFFGTRLSPEAESVGLGHVSHGMSHDYLDFFKASNAPGGASTIVEDVATHDVPVDAAIPIEDETEPAEAKPKKQRLTRVQIICRENTFEDLKEAMNRIGVTGMTVSHVLGCGQQKGAAEYYRGIPLEIQLLPKIQVDIVLAKVPVDLVVNTARQTLYTGHIGDGKIFISDVREAVKVRTGETGVAAMQGVDIV